MLGVLGMKKIVRFSGLCCANCAVKLETALNKIDGVNSAQLNFMAERIVFDIVADKYDVVVEEVKKVINKLEPDMEYKGL